MHSIADLLELVVEIVRRAKRLPVDDERRADDNERGAAPGTLDRLID